MATIAVGDIHGNLAALRDLLGQIHAVADSRDTIVFLGDYIDRGSETKGCIDAIRRFQLDIKTEVVCLIGNHEDWLLRTLRDYSRHSWLLGMEAFDTIRSYSANAASTLRDAASKAGPELVLGSCPLPYEAFFDQVPAEHIRFFETLRTYHRTPECLCSHGGLDPAVSSVEQQSRDALIWGTPTFPNEYNGSETVVYGHWNNAVITESGRPAPRIVGRTIGIDTISYGVLTAVRLPDQTVFQSAQFR